MVEVMASYLLNDDSDDDDDKKRNGDRPLCGGRQRWWYGRKRWSIGGQDIGEPGFAAMS